MAAANAPTTTLSDQQNELRNAQTKLLKAGKAKGDEAYGKMLDTLARVNEELKGLLEGSTPSAKQPSNHTPGTITTVILTPLYKGEKITVDATDGTETFTSARDFAIGYIDPNYVRLTKGRPAKPTEVRMASISQLSKNVDFKTMFSSLGHDNAELAWTNEEQVIKLCRAHKEKLNQFWWNFFLLEVEDDEAIDENEKKKYFVALVFVLGRGFGALVYRFDYPFTCSADSRSRVVVPQLQ